MNDRNPGNVSRLAQYRSLLSTDRAMLQLLAVSVDGCSPEVVYCCLKELRFSDDRGRRLTLAGNHNLIEKLIAKGLLLKTPRGIVCSESIRLPVFHDTLKEDTFDGFVRVLQRYHPLLIPRHIPAPPASYKLLLAELQMALFFHGSKKMVDDLIHVAYASFMDEYYENPPLLAVIGRPIAFEIIDRIDEGIRLAILSDLLGIVQNCLEPADDIVSLVNEKYAEDLGNHLLSVQLLHYYLLKGDTVSCQSVLDGLSDNFRLAKRNMGAWLDFISGRHKESLTNFTSSLQILKKNTGKRKIFFQSYAGIFFLLALLMDGTTASLRQALDLVALSKKNNYPLVPLLTLVEPIFHNRLGTAAGKTHDSFFPSYLNGPLDIFFRQLFRLWNDIRVAGDEISLLGHTRDKALNNGYPWLAAELSELLAARNHAAEANGLLAEKLHRSCNTVSFVRMVESQPQWEKTLNVLLHLVRPEKDAKEAPVAGQRLIWLFSHDEKYHFTHITPRLQKLSAGGSWTKGRPMALKTLYQGYHDMDGLTDQDRRICQAIREEYSRTGWHTKTEYFIDRDLALPALVGHPLVFLEHAPEVNVELVAAQPELRLKKVSGKLKLSVSPAGTGGAGDVMVQKDTPTRFKIIRWKPEYRQIVELLGKGLTIPMTGEKLAGQAVEALSGLLPVHSDLTADKTTAVQADSRPHAHILPYRDGISLEFLVKPIGTGGSSFLPGNGGRSVMAVADGLPIRAVRNLEEEAERMAQIVIACPTLGRLETTDNLWQVDAPEAALELLLEMKECGDDVVLEWPQGEKFKVRKQLSANKFSLRISRDHDWFKATGSLEIDDGHALDLRELLELLGRSTGRFLPLDDGTFLAITTSLRKRLEELHACTEGHGRGVRFAPVAALALEDLTRDIGKLQSDKAWQEHCRQLAEAVTPPVPSTLQAKLRDYQAIGFSWLARLSSWGVGACLADDMGLGKTVQALAAILLRASQGPSLVVAPLSVTSNWQEETRRFAPTLKVIVFGPGDRRQMIDDLQPFDLLIVSYGLLPLEADLLQSIPWQTVILDEAQAIKNMQTKRSKAAMGLRSACRIITTGTPLENHLGELWTLFSFLNPGLLGSFKNFNEKFAIPIERDQDKEARNRLRKLIRPFILRRLKSEVLHELPPKTEITLEVEMSREEQLLYEAQRRTALANIDAHRGEEAGQQHLRILAEIMKLRRLCCNPQLILPDTEVASSKLRVFADTLHELLDNNHKALVFSQFVDHLGIVRNYLEKQKIGYQYLDGSTPIAERKRRIAEFQNGSGDVFLISLKAGGSGLNLTAADYVIHMDPWWNPAVEDQASDRAHRIGQERPVTVYRLVMKDSIEQQIVALHARKRDLADSLLEGTDAAGKISAVELLALLHDQEA